MSIAPARPEPLDLVRDCGTCPLRPCRADASPLAYLPSCPISRRLLLGAGKHLYRTRDEAGGLLHVVLGGDLKLYRRGRNGCQHVIDFPAAGGWLGLDCIGQHVHDTSALALTDCVIAVVPYGRLMARMEQQPAAAEAFGRVLGDAFARRQRHGAMLRGGGAAQRVALFLLQRAPPGRDGSLPMSRQDIADYLALTPSTVSRVLAALRHRGWLELARRRYVLPDRGRLEQVAAGAPP